VPGKKIAHTKINYAEACLHRYTFSKARAQSLVDGATHARSFNHPTEMAKQEIPVHSR